MDLRRIRYFTVLAETLNFSRAAERLHIAQPALSVSIQKLEAELGTKLFDRTPTGVQLTVSGEAVLLDARRLLHHGERIKRTAGGLVQGTKGLLRIGFVGSAVYRLLPALVPRFRALYPEIDLELREATSVRIIEMLAEGSLDVGIVRTPLLGQLSGARLSPLQRDRFVVAAPREHWLGQRASVSMRELANEKFVMYSSSEAAGLRAAALAACQAAGFLPEVAQVAIQIPTVLALVASGLGIALVPDVMSLHRQEDLAYVEIDDLSEAGHNSLSLAYRDGSEGAVARSFIDFACEHCGPLGMPGKD